jgi:hypothetical protein
MGGEGSKTDYVAHAVRNGQCLLQRFDPGKGHVEIRSGPDSNKRNEVDTGNPHQQPRVVK